MKTRFVARLVKVSVCFVLLACDQKAPQLPTSTASPPPHSLEAALRIGSQDAIDASVEHSKRTGFPLEDSYVAQRALAKELATAQPRDAVIAALSDLLLQAEKNNRHTVPLELRRKVFDQLVRIHRTDQFPTNVVATSVLGFYEDEEAVSVLDETSRNTESARFKAAALALAFMCEASATKALDRMLEARSTSAEQRSVLIEAVQVGRANRVCR